MNYFFYKGLLRVVELISKYKFIIILCNLNNTVKKRYFVINVQFHIFKIIS